jgi:sirohydrochlorin ferrochelatase
MDTRQPTALLLIAHGSRHADANGDLHHLAAELRQQGAYKIVEPSFLELAEPTIDRAADLCVGAGAGVVILVPYFLSAGVHVLRDLSAARQRLAERFPAVRFHLARPIGRDPRLLDIVLDKVSEAMRRE